MNRISRDLARRKYQSDRRVSALSHKSKNRFAWISEAFFFLGTIGIAATGVGFAWRWEHFGWVGLLGLGSFFSAQWRYQKFWTVFVHSFLTGYLAFLIANPWMQWSIESVLESSPWKTFLVTQGTHVWHGGMFCAFGTLWWIGRKNLCTGWLLAPAIWLLIEANYPAMFPTRQGCLLLDCQPLTQIACIFGVTGVTLQAVLLAGIVPLLFAALTRRLSQVTAVRGLIAIAAFTTVHFVWGSYRIQQIETTTLNFAVPTLRVGIVQGDTEDASSHRNFVERSNRLAETCDLILWPECSLGHYERSLTHFADDNEVILHSADNGPTIRPWANPRCELLAGGYSWTRKPGQEKLETKYVSAYLFDETETAIGRHDKIELMAGGEYKPGEVWFPALARWLSAPADDEDIDPASLTRGIGLKPIGSVQGLSIAVLLCSEDMYSWLSRELVHSGGEVLFGLGNGMCFNSEIALRQHFNLARFRAIENNRYFVRCGSSGISGLISPTGTILESTACFDEVDLAVTVPIEHRTLTVFTRWGNYLNWASGVLFIGSLVLLEFFQRRAINPETQLAADPT